MTDDRGGMRFQERIVIVTGAARGIGAVTAEAFARHGARVALVDLVARAGLAKSKGEARRSIEQGGIYLNQHRIDDVGRTIVPEDWIGGRNLLLRKGKKEYALLRRG